MTVVAYGVDHGVVCSLSTVQSIQLNDYIASTTLLRITVYMQNVQFFASRQETHSGWPISNRLTSAPALAFSTP